MNQRWSGVSRLSGSRYKRGVKTIYLIGYRGSGKTTVGNVLANRLQIAFVDSDAEIIARAGKSIREIFEADGEESFRDLETKVIGELAKVVSAQVVSLGGGAILRVANRESIESGFVVWLQASVEQLSERLAGDATTATHRPPLANFDSMETEVRQVLAERTPLYKNCANLSVFTDGKSVDEIVDEIVRAQGG